MKTFLVHLISNAGPEPIQMMVTAETWKQALQNALCVSNGLYLTIKRGEGPLVVQVDEVVLQIVGRCS